MRIATIDQPNTVDAIQYDMEAHVDGQTYRLTHFGHVQAGRRLADVADPRAELVKALEKFAHYIRHSVRIPDHEQRRSW